VEVVIVGVILLVFAIATLFAYDFFGDIMSDVVDDPDISASATGPSEGLLSQYPGMFDTAFVIILTVLWIATIISAFQIDTYPVFFGISVFALIVSLVVAPVLGNAYEDTFSDDTVSTLPDSFPAIHYVMTHILQISILIGGSVLVALFAKARAG